MKVKVNKNRSYREKQRKAAAINAGKMPFQVSEHILEKVMLEFNLSRAEAIHVMYSMPRVHALAVPYGAKGCCHLCGRQNWPAWGDLKKGTTREFNDQKALYLVDAEFNGQPMPGQSMLLCYDCIASEAERRFNTRDFALGNEGICTNFNPWDSFININFQSEEDMVCWLKRKHQLDSEIWDIQSRVDIMRWLRELQYTHILNVNGVQQHDYGYEMMCRELDVK